MRAEAYQSSAVRPTNRQRQKQRWFWRDFHYDWWPSQNGTREIDLASGLLFSWLQEEYWTFRGWPSGITVSVGNRFGT